MEVDVRRDSDKRQSPHYHSRSHFSFSLTFATTASVTAPAPKEAVLLRQQLHILSSSRCQAPGRHFILGPCLDLHLNQQKQQKSNDNSHEEVATLSSTRLEGTLYQLLIKKRCAN